MGQVAPGYTGTGEYKNVFPPELSLEDCEGDPNAKFIEFIHDVEVEKHVIKDLSPLYRSRTTPLACYHSHVLWSYSHWTVRNRDGTLGFGLISVGPYMRHERKEGDGDAPPNAPEGLREPRIKSATYTFTDKEGREKETFAFSNGPEGKWLAIHLFTEKDLLARADGDRVYIRLRIVIPRSYFSLSKLLKKPTTVSAGTEEVVQTILRGDKPPGSDWSITVGSAGGDCSLPRTYHVHSTTLSTFGGIFKRVFKTRRSYSMGRLDFGGDLSVLYRPEQRAFHIAYLAPDDMTVLIPLIYGMDPPLPTNVERIRMLGRVLVKFLQDTPEVFHGVFPQWERAICEQALALDKTDPASFEVIAHLLLIIWYTPYGLLPVAKRVAIGVYADMVRLHKPAGMTDSAHIDNTDAEHFLALLRWTFDKVLDNEYIIGAFVNNIRLSMGAHYVQVSAVRKVGLSAGTNKQKESAVVVDSTTPDSDGQTDVNDDDDDGRKEEERIVRVPTPGFGEAYHYDEEGKVKRIINLLTGVETLVNVDYGKKEEQKRDGESPPTPPVVTRNLDVPTVLNVDDFLNAVDRTEENPDPAQSQCSIS